MINDNRSDAGYRTITNVVDGKTKECENLSPPYIHAYIYMRIFNNRQQKCVLLLVHISQR